MNLDNVVLVRATNHLPVNNVILPSSEAKYLIKNNPSDYKYAIRKFIKRDIESKIGRELLLWEDNDRELYESVAKDYYPYTSRYTSTLSFSLNGLAPDDINNNFTNKKIAIIDPIKYHLDDPYLNMDVIDTTINGKTVTSKECILVIRKDYYDSLSDEEKVYLQNNYRIELFNEDLRNAVNTTLLKYNYPSLPLIQNREKDDINDCEEKMEMIAFQDKFAQSHNISRLKLQFLYTYPINEMDEVDARAALVAQQDTEKNEFITTYYQNMFYEFLIQKSSLLNIELTEEEKFYLLSNFSKSGEILDSLVSSIIDKIGLNGLKNIILEYNNYVETNYLTNQELIDRERNRH